MNTIRSKLSSVKNILDIFESPIFSKHNLPATIPCILVRYLSRVGLPWHFEENHGYRNLSFNDAILLKKKITIIIYFYKPASISSAKLTLDSYSFFST